MQLLFLLHSLSRPVRLASPAFTRRGVIQRVARYFSQQLILRGRRKRMRTAHEGALTATIATAAKTTIAASHSTTALPLVFGSFGFVKEF